jgi:hypothetical protein
LLNFCLDDLSIGKSGILKSHTIIVLGPVLFYVLQCIYVYDCHSLSMHCSLYRYEVTFFVYSNLTLKSVLPDTNITSSCFCGSIQLEYIFLSFSL